MLLCLRRFSFRLLLLRAKSLTNFPSSFSSLPWLITKRPQAIPELETERASFYSRSLLIFSLFIFATPPTFPSVFFCWTYRAGFPALLSICFLSHCLWSISCCCISHTIITSLHLYENGNFQIPNAGVRCSYPLLFASSTDFSRDWVVYISWIIK